MHTAEDLYNIKLRVFCDLNAVVRRCGAEMDWLMLGAHARQWGIVRAVYVILRLARELLEVAVPEDWLASLQPASLDERYLTLTREQILADSRRAGGGWLQSPRVAQLWGPKRLGAKLAVIRVGLLPSRERMALMYPAPTNSWRIYLYYPVRLKDVFVRQGAAMWRLARGDPKTRAVAARTNQATALRDWLMSG